MNEQVSPNTSSETVGNVVQLTENEERVQAGGEAVFPTEQTAEKTGEEAAAGAVETKVDEQPGEKPASNLSRDDIVEILKEAGLGGEERQTAPAAAAEPELTVEQFEKAFNVYKPSEDLVRRLTDESPAVRIKAMTEYRDGVVKQAMTMVEYRINQRLGTLQSSVIEPLQSYVSERQAREFHDEFFEQYPDLQPYEIIVDAVAAKLQERGFTAKNRDEVMKRFADDAKAAVSALLAKGGTASGGAATATGSNGGGTVKTQRRMSTLSSGGQGGTTKAGGGGDDKYKDLPPNVAAGLAALD
jgi:hypothetical protein